ncbi:MAG: hypothetical protein ABFS21_00065 [Actinomycetota bacterium]
MPRFHMPRVLIGLVLAVALVAVGCSPEADPTTTTAATGSTLATSTTAAESTTTTTTQVTFTIPGAASDSIDPEIVEEMHDELAVLMVEAEEVRGLPFVETPTVTILDDAEFRQRVADLLAEDLDQEELAVDTAFLTMLGMLKPGTDLYQLLIDLYTEQVAGFYDGDAEEMVVPAAPDGFTPLQKITVVHELVHALTDQHFEFNTQYEDLIDTGNGDDAAAFQALIEGDATHAQFVYMESLSPLEAVQAATEALTYDTSVLDSVPSWMQLDLTFPYQQGLLFVESLISTGGLVAIDTAYQDAPITTEQILDAAKFNRREQPRDMPLFTVDLSGWDLHEEAAFGEWGIRLLLDTALPPGVATQAAAGWGNDAYRVFARGGDVAMAMVYVGDSQRDAEEFADALIAHVRDGMNAGPAEESGGGLLYRQGDVYTFIDRIDDTLYWIVSTDPLVGEDLRLQLGL